MLKNSEYIGVYEFQFKNKNYGVCILCVRIGGREYGDEVKVMFVFKNFIV